MLNQPENLNVYPKKKLIIDEKQIKKEDKNIYQLTINNFISPNFNIISKSEPLVKKQKNQEK